MEALLFWIFSIVGVVCGVMVIWHRNPMGSAIYLVVTMLCLSGLYALLNGAFVAVLQVLIYAGAVMVLMLFVIMMLSVRAEGAPREGSMPVWVISGVIGLFVIFKVGSLFSFGKPPEAVDEFGTIQGVGSLLFNTYVLPFELISVLLLIAVIGAVILSKRDAQ
ncbi:NADH-quinone oxidoreductase subunit J family protein [Candidatus Entotheonella palauensis]|uniref:NADH-quinone oxidoreductase subunit J family protein n=1 Tax=Candidatus Entotheonella palauensis TaxID=93172 RepID=UPI000B7EF061|nr:NADH-quinone oxidoreductase subunit J [Candidatus Entotheonella palauensis]